MPRTLSPQRFDRFIDRIGQQCAWRRAYACPCINPNSGAADPACPICKGKKWAWQAAVTGKAALSGQSVQRRWTDLGQFEPGDVVFSIGMSSPLFAIGYADRVVLLNDTQRFSLVLTRGDGDTLTFPVIAITRVYWLNDAKQEVDGSIPTVNATTGVLTWANPLTAPPSGKSYSITGTRYAEYFCWGDLPQDRGHFSGLPLPKRVVLRLYDLFGR